MKTILRTVAVTVLFLGVVASVGGTVWVNEAMVNEPSDSVMLEWIELYNDGTNEENLSFFGLQVGTDVLDFFGLRMPGRSFAIICRDSVQFVERWFPGGHSDSVVIIPKDFKLLNTTGGVTLSRLSNLESELFWPGAGTDGVSWERRSIIEDTALQSVDPSGSTPGRFNSLLVLPYDLALDVVDVSAINGTAHIEFKITNLGLNPVASTELSINLFDSLAVDSIGAVLQSLFLPDIDSGYTFQISRTLQRPGYYEHLVVSISDDDRAENNRRFFYVPGEDFPPLAVSEFMPNPSGNLDAEWIELYNWSDTTFDLSGWAIGDNADEISLGEGAPMIEPGEFVVLTSDSVLFLHFYRLFKGKLFEPSSWRILNNSGDAVILIDEHGLIPDRYDYTEVFDSNLTWGRNDVEHGGTLWGRSSEPGGTPGESNSVLIKPEASGLSVQIIPEIFSPDDNGWEDETVISITAPDADYYTLKIYDRYGRVVKTFLDESSYLSAGGIYVWDGRSDGGSRLQVGIYIMHFEAGGVESVRKTVVVAR